MRGPKPPCNQKHQVSHGVSSAIPTLCSTGLHSPLCTRPFIFSLPCRIHCTQISSHAKSFSDGSGTASNVQPQNDTSTRLLAACLFAAYSSLGDQSSVSCISGASVSHELAKLLSENRGDSIRGLVS